MEKAVARIYRCPARIVRRNLLTFEGVVHRARLVAERDRTHAFRHVLVDKPRDFGLEALRLIRAMGPIKEELKDPPRVVGAGRRRIYNLTPFPLNRSGIHLRGIPAG